MIQRIQTVYLALGAGAVVALLFLDPIWSSTAQSSYAWFGPTLISLGGLIVLTALAGIFGYKNRKQQQKVVLVAQYLTLMLALVLYGALFFSGGLVVRTTEGINGPMLIALLVPLAAYVLFALARRSIQKDIDKVKSMDRLR